MRKRYAWLGLLATAMVAGNASAITVDGNWNDWTSYAGTTHSNWNQSSAAAGLLNPAFREWFDTDYDANGGQNYDIEQMFYYYEDIDPNALSGGTLYIGMVTGYEDYNSTYDSGDMFVDLGKTGTYDLAVATDQGDVGWFGKTWKNDGWQTSNPGDHDGSPYRVKEYKPGATLIGTSSIAWGYGVGPGDKHNFLEMGIALTGAMEEKIAYGGIGIHWTMECGNDYIDVCDTNPLSTIPPPPPPPPFDPIPEPASMVLLGMGLTGMAIRARKTQA